MSKREAYMRYSLIIKKISALRQATFEDIAGYLKGTSKNPRAREHR